MLLSEVAVTYLRDTFSQKLIEYFSFLLIIEVLIASLGVLLAAVISFWVWRPYVSNLNNNIWRTKGMLSMIPIEVLLANENLRTTLLSGDLMKAVK